MANEDKRTFFERLSNLDRRVIFLLIALAVIIPLIVHYTTSIPPSLIVQTLYDKVDGMSPGAKILVSFDYGPSTVPENQPMANALVRHALEKGHRVYLMALWPTGARQSQ